MFDILWTGRSTILYRSATRREQARWASSQCYWRSCSERGRRAGPPTPFKSLFSIVIVRSKHESLTHFFSWNLSSSGEENSCKYRWGCTRTSWCQHGKWLIDWVSSSDSFRSGFKGYFWLIVLLFYWRRQRIYGQTTQRLFIQSLTGKIHLHGKLSKRYWRVENKLVWSISDR